MKNGGLTPESLIKIKFIANGKWVSIDNIERFHRNSPVSYPPGPYLIQSRKIKNRRQGQMHGQAILVSRYGSGEMIENYLDLIPVKNLCGHFNVSAASRLTAMPAFDPELVITFIFGSNSLSIKIIRGITPIWNTIAQYTSRTTKGVVLLSKSLFRLT